MSRPGDSAHKDRRSNGLTRARDGWGRPQITCPSNEVMNHGTQEFQESGWQPGSGRALVTMMKTTDTRPRYHISSAGAARSLFWSLLLESTVRAILVVVRDIRREQPLQMRLA